MIWLETPSNPLIAIADIAAAAASRDSGSLVVVDSTFATPLLQRPMEHGADIVVHSATKYIGGHADLLLGLAVCRDAAAARALWEIRHREGAIPGSLEAYLALRGLRTLGVRLDRAQASAGELARRLESHPAVTRVRYPGLPDDPGHAVASRQMDGYGAMLSFETLGDAAAAERRLRARPRGHCRDQPGRHREPDRAARPVRVGAPQRHAADAAAAVRRHRARRGSVGRPRPGAAACRQFRRGRAVTATATAATITAVAASVAASSVSSASAHPSSTATTGLTNA